MFIDEVKIKVIAWKWWDWMVAWRREKFMPKWGPWGWDGWRWWAVYMEADDNLNTLSDFRHKKILRAKDWDKWDIKEMHWAAWDDLVIKVPVWTIIRDSNTNEVLYDLDKPSERLLVCKWWRWGYGNSHFVTSVRQAPNFAELGDVWEEQDLYLELKLVADIWIIWIPSAWKSSLINTLTAVKAKVWDYPFTTLVPNGGCPRAYSMSINWKMTLNWILKTYWKDRCFVTYGWFI